jgi:cytochrome c553
MSLLGKTKRRKVFQVAAAYAVVATLSVVAAAADAADAFEIPAWAYPVMDEGRGRGPDDGTLLSTPDSDLRFTQTQINDRFNPPDWYPDEHPPPPEVVSHGRPPLVRACGQCHMLHGMGHPESSAMAGLPVDYVIQQMRDYKSGARTSMDGRRDNSMRGIAADISDDEIRLAAEYFARLDPVKWVTVIESELVPETYVGAGNMRHAEPEGSVEPIGRRIIEIPEESHRAELRDSHSGFIAYVPPGSIEAGRELATTGGGKTIQCDICHGPDLKGLGNVPGIAGRSPIYTARQLWDIKYGSRAGTSAALMLGVVASLTDEDVLSLAAYTASLDP